MKRKKVRQDRRKRNKKQKKKKDADWKVGEDPFLLDDPGGSPLEWLDFTMIEPIRLSCPSEPWERSPDPLESESRTERYRRKLQELTLDLEFDEGSDPDKSVA